MNKVEPVKTAIVTDFDGTITKVDTCFAMVQTFAKEGWQELNKLWEEKKISTTDCANQTFALFDATPEDIKGFLDTMEIDDYFKDFRALCREKGYELYILSDGYDFNIETILKKYGINDVKFFANRLLYEQGNGFSMESPSNNPICGNCGTCKTNFVKKLKEDGYQVVYIGDGHSDMCAAEKADVVFAKGTLYQYCREKGIEAVEFGDFRGIIDRLL